MNNKELYVESLHVELDAMDREISSFELRLATLTDHHYLAFKERLDEIHKHREEICLRCMEIEAADDSTWGQLREDFQTTWLAFVESIRKMEMK